MKIKNRSRRYILRRRESSLRFSGTASISGIPLDPGIVAPTDKVESGCPVSPPARRFRMARVCSCVKGHPLPITTGDIDKSVGLRAKLASLKLHLPRCVEVHHGGGSINFLNNGENACRHDAEKRYTN
jgi:hypothetical protein